MAVIYLDVLLVVNLFVNYFLLLSTAGLLHQSPRRRRLILSAAIGSLFSLMIFLPNLGILNVPIKVAMGIFLVFVAFGFGGKTVFLKNCLSFLAVNFIFAGVMIALWLLVSPSGMYWNNGTVYFSISALALTIGTIAAYLVVKLICFLLNRRVQPRSLVPVRVTTGYGTAELTALYDSGNHFVDPFTSLPVVVCEYDSVKNCIPGTMQPLFQNPTGADWSSADTGFSTRLLPYHTVGHEGVIPVFRPEEFLLLQSEHPVKREAFIGVTTTPLSQGEFHGILHADMI